MDMFANFIESGFAIYNLAMNLTLPPGASAFSQNPSSFHRATLERVRISRSFETGFSESNCFCEKKLDEWYNKIFDEDWGSAGLNEYLLGGNLGSMQWYVWVASAVHVIYLHH